mgnify:CR=1 FL=1
MYVGVFVVIQGAHKTGESSESPFLLPEKIKEHENGFTEWLATGLGCGGGRD